MMNLTQFTLAHAEATPHVHAHGESHPITALLLALLLLAGAGMFLMQSKAGAKVLRALRIRNR